MEVRQQLPYAPGLDDQWQLPGTHRGQTPPTVPEQPLDPDEFAQQLRDMRALGVRFPLWSFWFRGRRWSATGYTGERVEGGSAAEIAALLGGGKPAPPEDRAHPLATGPCPVRPVIGQVGQRGSPQAGEPWPPQTGPQHPPLPLPRQAQPMPQASSAA